MKNVAHHPVLQELSHWPLQSLTYSAPLCPQDVPTKCVKVAQRWCSFLTVSHVLPEKFLVPHFPQLSFVSFIKAAWATIIQGNSFLTDSVQ